MRWWPGTGSAVCSAPPWGISTCTSRSEEHTSELQSRPHLVCRLLLEKKKNAERFAAINVQIKQRVCAARRIGRVKQQHGRVERRQQGLRRGRKCAAAVIMTGELRVPQ